MYIVNKKRAAAEDYFDYVMLARGNCQAGIILRLLMIRYPGETCAQRILENGQYDNRKTRDVKRKTDTLRLL